MRKTLLFAAAAIQRTSKIRIGPLVYVLPLHHPLRLYEEICMILSPAARREMLTEYEARGFPGQ